MICWVIRLLTALRWAPTKGTRRSPCRRCPQSAQPTTTARWRKPPAYSGHPALRPSPFALRPSPFALRPSPFALRASLRLFKIAPGDFVSLHAGVASEADEREKLERLCRYITRPAVSTERLSLTAQGNIRYRLAAPAHPARAAFVHPCTALRASKIQW